MRTDELVSMLATAVDAVEPGARLRRRYEVALSWGALGAAVLLAIFLDVRPDLVEALRLPMFWAKLAFPGVLLAGALLAAMRLSRPGARLGLAPAAIAAAVLAMWLLAAVALLGAPPQERATLIFGASWRSCPFNIALLSAPAFVALLWAMKGLAPTRLALAGAAAGLLAGAAGALIYALHCTEMAPPFLGIWYLLGMLIPALLGAVVGPRLLRW